MTTNVIDAATEKGSFATPGQGERALLLLFPTQEPWAVVAREREDTDIDAQDILMQAEEALVIG